jgi:hypothetical protein
MTQAEFNQLLSRIKVLPPKQLRQLRRQLDEQLAQAKTPSPAASAKHARPAAALQPGTRVTEEEFQQHLLSIGLITSLPDPAQDIDDDDPDDQPVPIKGEPLSETIIRERR